MTWNLLHKHLHIFWYFFQIESILILGHILARQFIQHIIQLVWFDLYPAVIWKSKEINHCIMHKQKNYRKINEMKSLITETLFYDYCWQRHQIKKANNVNWPRSKHAPINDQNIMHVLRHCNWLVDCLSNKGVDLGLRTREVTVCNCFDSTGNACHWIMALLK